MQTDQECERALQTLASALPSLISSQSENKPAALIEEAKDALTEPEEELRRLKMRVKELEEQIGKRKSLQLSYFDSSLAF